MPLHFMLTKKGVLIGVDICIRKPLIATCSTDNSVRIWNYMDKTTDLVKVFPEEAFSLAFHQSGTFTLQQNNNQP